jgi:hypothetical protein
MIRHHTEEDTFVFPLPASQLAREERRLGAAPDALGPDTPRPRW